MHRSESGKLDSLSNVIETRRKNRLHLISIFYCGNITFECGANETAKHEMEKFYTCMTVNNQILNSDKYVFVAFR